MSEGDRGVFSAVVSQAPLLVFRTGTSLLGLAFGAWRSGSRFKRSLRRRGLPAPLARKLSQRYRKSFSLRQWIALAMRARKFGR